VKGAGVKGIFVASPGDVCVKQTLVVGEGEHGVATIGRVSIALSDVETMFPDQNIYTMDSNGLQLLRPKGGSSDHSR